MKNAETVGLIGMGAMGSGMAHSLLTAGFSVLGFDVAESSRQRHQDRGGVVADSASAVVASAPTVLLSLPSPDVAESVLAGDVLPACRDGQIVLDLTTLPASMARRWSERLAERGATYIDAPVTGGVGGAESGSLRIFLGASRDAVEPVLPVLHAIGDANQIAFCGECGHGQILKGVNQMAMGLIAAAAVESIAFGINAGLDPQLIETVAGDSGFRAIVRHHLRQLQSDDLSGAGVKHGQLAYFLDEAESCGFDLPISRAVFDYLKDRPAEIREANRMSPSFWNALTAHDT